MAIHALEEKETNRKALEELKDRTHIRLMEQKQPQDSDRAISLNAAIKCVESHEYTLKAASELRELPPVTPQRQEGEKMNIPKEDVIIASLCKLNYLKGVITGTISNDIPYKEYTDCIRYCNSLITLLQDMIEMSENEKGGE